MAKILILGGGFGGVVAAEQLAQHLSDEHQITLVSRTRKFTFYPGLVRLAFGKCDESDISFDLRQAMLNRRINFVEAEVAHFNPEFQRVSISRGEVEGNIPYDYLIFALGRRLATECIPGFYEHAQHLLNVNNAIHFGKNLKNFHEGHVVIGYCKDARLPVPVFETAFALARQVDERGEQGKVRITLVTPGALGDEFGETASIALRKALAERQIEIRENFAIQRVSDHSVFNGNGENLSFDLLMLMPPFRGSAAAHYLKEIDADGYIKVDSRMRVNGHSNIYAVGDCVSFDGPKMGHMAVRQAEVAAKNLVSQINGEAPHAHYAHEMKLVIEDTSDSLYLHKDLWSPLTTDVKQGRFWAWAKHVQQRYWNLSHS